MYTKCVQLKTFSSRVYCNLQNGKLQKRELKGKPSVKRPPRLCTHILRSYFLFLVLYCQFLCHLIVNEERDRAAREKRTSEDRLARTIKMHKSGKIATAVCLCFGRHLEREGSAPAM